MHHAAGGYLCVPKTSSALITSATMVALIFLCFNLVASLFKSKSRLEAENAVLRHQLTVLQARAAAPSSPTVIACSSSSVSLSSVDPQGYYDHPAGDPREPASCWVSPLLALKITTRGRPAANPCGIAGVDLADER